MTNVSCENDRGAYSILIEGHAGFSNGLDIVCSAASILTFTLMNAIENKEMDYKEISYDSGEAKLHFKPTPENASEVNTIIETIMLGFTLLEKEYPDNVSVEW
jgi:uncharacterized protein YsxB (DUF464 family)